ncbi:GDSL-type esterase/lipase family protein [Nocardia sp. NPDC057353]|uniref:GDSL-type esterase/lipase family protein n=1 Tax=Nocardia sp. NPDC057353 TaxID=3346104 RepID=UPI0036260EF6
MPPTPITPDLVHGAAELEATPRGLRPHRLPGWARRQFPDPYLGLMQAQTSGVRLLVRTAATALTLTTHPSRLTYTGLARPRGRIDVAVDGEVVLRDELTGGDHTETDPATGAATPHSGPPHSTAITGLPGRDVLVEIWLPHNEAVELVALDADAPIAAVSEPGRRWVNYGSSISQGSNAAGPSEIWPVLAARSAGLRLRNLGFGGNAMVDPFVARTIRDAPAELISLELGINVVNGDAMRLRAFVPAVHGFLDTVRDGHPDTPLLLVSPLYCGIHEDTPGPGAFDPASLAAGTPRFIATGDPADVPRGRLTLRTVRAALAEIAAQRADPNLHHLDGTELYGPADAETHPLPDGLHPDTATHHLVGTRFAQYLARAEFRRG